MKKRYVVVLVLFALLAGFLVGNRPWEWLRPFRPIVVIPQARLEIDRRGVPKYFSISETPQFSSDHYYFREGFTDVDEYWSFSLPPELAEEFLAECVRKNQLPPAESFEEIPDWVSGQPARDEWDGRFWFSDITKLDQVYYKKYLFCGYSAERNRIYLMNWND